MENKYLKPSLSLSNLTFLMFNQKRDLNLFSLTPSLTGLIEMKKLQGKL